MPRSSFNGFIKALRPFRAVVMAVLAISAWTRAEDTVAGYSRLEALRLGERMYRQGILPSGAPMEAVLHGDTPVPGAAFSCMSCHLRSGLGSEEGGTLTQAVSGPKLYAPAYKDFPNHTPAQRANLPLRWQTPPRRPAYTDESLARSIREGIDSAGRELNPVMPRYRLEDRDMAVLVFYLKNLSAEVPPGVTETTLKFATVLTDGVPVHESDLMLKTLEAQFTAHNNLGQTFNTRGYNTTMMMEGTRGYRQWSLALWKLKGAPGTWPSQLEALYRKDPVFALVGGMASGSWKPIHDFCESHQLPDLFPVTNLPVISPTDAYTFYFSKGYEQEGSAAASHLASLAAEKKVLQIVGAGPEGQALSAGFSAAWAAMQRPPAMDLVLSHGQRLNPGSLKRIIAQKKPDVILFWTGPEDLPALAALQGSTGTTSVYVSSTRIGDLFRAVPAPVRAFTYLTYPFRSPQDPRTPTRGKENPGDPQRIGSRMYTLAQLLAAGHASMDQNFYRDNFLDVLSELPDQNQTDYERLSFGPGQRYASKGCYIMQLTADADPRLVKASEWITR
jgi:ABC-type branched-subunit amino acid transport system substrate-binding protein